MDNLSHSGSYYHQEDIQDKLEDSALVLNLLQILQITCQLMLGKNH
jgi:hypothetical protein